MLICVALRIVIIIIKTKWHQNKNKMKKDTKTKTERYLGILAQKPTNRRTKLCCIENRHYHNHRGWSILFSLKNIKTSWHLKTKWKMTSKQKQKNIFWQIIKTRNQMSHKTKLCVSFNADKSEPQNWKVKRQRILLHDKSILK